jgi:hypothetical protein
MDLSMSRSTLSSLSLSLSHSASFCLPISLSLSLCVSLLLKKIHKSLHRISPQKIGIWSSIEFLWSSIWILHWVLCMNLYKTIWKILMELHRNSMVLHRNSMVLHMPIFCGEILWRLLWNFPVRSLSLFVSLCVSLSLSQLICCYFYIFQFDLIKEVVQSFWDSLVAKKFWSKGITSS